MSAPTFSNLYRSDFKKRLTTTQFDLLVIGGGITGCGIALDAALRGLKVALIEKNDFASGTSSRSTKLIHGGLRYLKQMEIKLVHDVGSERAIVHRNARHVVIPEKMLLPIVEGGSLGSFTTSVGLLVYDLLAGVKTEERRRMLDRHETHKAEPLLATDKLLGGGLYFEYRTDDSRLVIELAKSAFANGAVLLNYAESQHFVYNTQGKIKGVQVKDKLSGENFTIQTKLVVNACGPWVDLLRKEDNSLKGKRLQLTKGVHIVFPQSKLPLKQAAYFDVDGGRMIFAIPRDGVTYVGTTDTVYNQEIDKPRCTKADATYLLKAVNKMFPSVQLKEEDIVSSWAGLRPLIHEDGKSPSELSRKDEIMISESGLISIAGGKLTGYRLMAEKITDLAAKTLGKSVGGSLTKNYRLSGGAFNNDAEFAQAVDALERWSAEEQIPRDHLKRWFFRYGSNLRYLVDKVKLLRHNQVEGDDLYCLAELYYCIEYEMIYHLSDFFIRRTGKIFFDHQNSERQLQFVQNVINHQLHVSINEGQQMLQQTAEEYRWAVTFEP